MSQCFNHNDDVLNRLKDIIVRNLLPLIDDDYSLLDIPNHNNIGDSLILGGEYELLKQSPFHLLYKSSRQYGKEDHIPANGILLMHGGGNFGDVWHGPHSFRRRIILKRKHQKIIIFPQTVFYNDIHAAHEDARIYSEHPDLTICARDERSFYFLKEYFPKNSILLIPDMAFVLNLFENNTWDVMKMKKLVFLNRTDKELSSGNNYLRIIKDKFQDQDIYVTDWPLLNPRGVIAEKMYWKINDFQKLLIQMIDRSILRKVLIDGCYGLGKRDKYIQLIGSGISLFSKYEIVYTNRLHGMILGLLLGKTVYCFDNNYGKNSEFYNTWLKASTRCEMIRES